MHVFARSIQTPNPSKQDLEFLERLVSRRFGDMVDRVRSADVVSF